MREVACPVALHPDGAPLRIAAEVDPAYGLRLVHVALETGVAPVRAAAQALFDHGALETRAALPLGASDGIEDDVRWHFVLCRVAPPVRDAWQQPGATDGASPRRFVWQPLDTAPTQTAEPASRALQWIRGAL